MKFPRDNTASSVFGEASQAMGSEDQTKTPSDAYGGRPLSRRVFARRDARPALVFLLILAAAALIGPELFPDALRGTSDRQFQPPGPGHLLGTDLNGRDVLYRLLTGARVSLVVGIAGAFVSLTIGVLWGMAAGYFGGRADRLMMRVVDILYAVPRLILILILVNVFDQGFQTWLHERLAGTFLAGLTGYSKVLLMIAALGCIEWLTMARIIRGQVLALRESQFVLAARALGRSHAGILFCHLLPNLWGTILVCLTLAIPTVIIDESFISFLGLGLDASQASWGVLLSEGAQAINPLRIYWWLLVAPAAPLTATLLALNHLGEIIKEEIEGRRPSRLV